jgi:hypothetical protein
LAAVREALPDLKASGEGSVLVTNGAYGDDAPAMDALAVRTGAMGLAVGNAAKRKLVGLLAERLRDEGVFVGEVNVAGGVRGTAWAGEGGIDPAVIADRFWSLHRARGETRARVV